MSNGGMDPAGGLGMRRMNVGPQIEGRYVARTVYDRRGRVLLRPGVYLTANLLRLLGRHGVDRIWVTDRLLPRLEVGKAVRHETRVALTSALLRIIKQVETGVSDGAIAEVRLKRAVTLLVDDILENDDVVSNVAHLRSVDSYSYAHSLQVAILSVIVGKALALPYSRLHHLATGALLADIGKARIPKEILDKPGPLTTEERTVVEGHCRAGWDIVHQLLTIPPTASIVTLQHHERMDGSGYPGSLTGDQIYLFSRIVAVADVFDALRAERPWRSSLAPSEVLHVFHDGMGRHFDAAVTSLLFDKVALVPDGEVVTLTDGTVGRVLAQRPGYPLQPLVVLVSGGDGTPLPEEVVDLSHDGRQVARIENDWPEEIQLRLQSPESEGDLDKGGTQDPEG